MNMTCQSLYNTLILQVKKLHTDEFQFVPDPCEINEMVQDTHPMLPNPHTPAIKNSM